MTIKKQNLYNKKNLVDFDDRKLEIAVFTLKIMHV